MPLQVITSKQRVSNMPVIRQERQFYLSPVGVRSFDTGVQRVGQAVTNFAQTVSDELFREAASLGQQEAQDAALAINKSDFFEFDKEGKPVPLTVPKEYGRIRREVYLDVVNKRYDQEIQDEIIAKSNEYAQKYPSVAGYTKMMDGYIEATFGAAEGRFKQSVLKSSADVVAKTTANLRIQEEKARIAAAKRAATLNVISARQKYLGYVRTGSTGVDATVALAAYEKSILEEFQLTDNVTAFNRNMEELLKTKAFESIGALYEQTQGLSDSQRTIISEALENPSFAQAIEDTQLRLKVVQLQMEFSSLPIGTLKNAYSSKISSGKAIKEVLDSEWLSTNLPEINKNLAKLSADLSAANAVKNLIKYHYEIKDLAPDEQQMKLATNETFDAIRAEFVNVIDQIPASQFDSELADRMFAALGQDSVDSRIFDEVKENMDSPSGRQVVTVLEALIDNLSFEDRQELVKNITPYVTNRVQAEASVDRKESDEAARKAAHFKSIRDAKLLIAKAEREARETAEKNANAVLLAEVKADFDFYMSPENLDEEKARAALARLNDLGLSTLTPTQLADIATLQKQGERIGVKIDQAAAKGKVEESIRNISANVELLISSDLTEGGIPREIEMLRSQIRGNPIFNDRESERNRLLNQLRDFDSKYQTHIEKNQKQGVKDNFDSTLMRTQDLVRNNAATADDVRILKSTVSTLPVSEQRKALESVSKIEAEFLTQQVFQEFSSFNQKGYSSDIADLINLRLGGDTSVSFADAGLQSYVNKLVELEQTGLNIQPTLSKLHEIAKKRNAAYIKSKDLDNSVKNVEAVGISASQEDVDNFEEAKLFPILNVDSSASAAQAVLSKPNLIYSEQQGQLQLTKYGQELSKLFAKGVVPKHVIDVLNFGAKTPNLSSVGFENLRQLYGMVSNLDAAGNAFNIINNQGMPYSLDEQSLAILSIAAFNHDVLKTNETFAQSLLEVSSSINELGVDNIEQHLEAVLGKKINKFVVDNYPDVNPAGRRFVLNAAKSLANGALSEDDLKAKIDYVIEQNFGYDEKIIGTTVGYKSRGKKIPLVFGARSSLDASSIAAMDADVEQRIIRTLNATDQIMLTAQLGIGAQSRLYQKAAIEGRETRGVDPGLEEINLGLFGPLQEGAQADESLRDFLVGSRLTAEWGYIPNRNDPNLLTVVLRKENGTYQPTILTVDVREYTPIDRALSEVLQSMYTNYRAAAQNFPSSVDMKSNEHLMSFNDDVAFSNLIAENNPVKLFDLATHLARNPELIQSEDHLNRLNTMVEKNIFSKRQAEIIRKASGFE